MKKVKIISLLVLLLSASTLSAVERDIISKTNFPIVNGGLKFQANASNFLTRDIPNLPNLRSTMNVAGEIGGFVDFNLGKHFLIQLNVMLFATQNDWSAGFSVDKMWTAGIEIPMYFLGRYGSEQNGYIYFGGGPFTQFAVWGQIDNGKTKYNPYQPLSEGQDMTDQNYVFSNNNSGLGAYLGYELPCRLQFNASYQVGISDLLLLEQNPKTFVCTQKVTLGIAYRFK